MCTFVFQFTFQINKNNWNKTWSSVSNSSLSKTFALCQFRKLKVQKTGFSRFKHSFGSKKNESKKILIRKKIKVPKKFGFEKILVGKKFRVLKKFWIRKKFLDHKKFWVWKKFVSKKFWHEKKFCLEKFLVQNFLLLFLLFLWYGPLAPKLSQKPMSSLCVKFQPSSILPTDRFWWGLLLFLFLFLWQG